MQGSAGRQPTDRAALTPGLRMFISYSHRDERFLRELEKQLAMLRRQGLVESWSDRRLAPGDDWAKGIDDAMRQASIFLLLVSPDFLASTYCFDVELKEAMERHRNGTARVVPVIVRPADWQDASFAGLQAVPAGAKPVVRWGSRDEAWLNVVEQLRLMIAAMRSA